MTPHQIYWHPFTDGAKVTPVEYHLLIEAALNGGIAGIFRVNNKIAKGREILMQNLYHPN